MSLGVEHLFLTNVLYQRTSGNFFTETLVSVEIAYPLECHFLHFVSLLKTGTYVNGTLVFATATITHVVLGMSVGETF